MTTTTILHLLAASGLVALFLMARHSSETPEVLGRWSLRYMYLLALVATGTLALGAFSVPAWRARLLRRSEQPATRRQAWALLAGGLLLLPVASLVLQALLPVQESSLMRALLILTLCGLTLPVLWLMHRSGAGYLPLQLRRPGLLLILLIGLQLAASDRCGSAWHPRLKTEGGDLDRAEQRCAPVPADMWAVSSPCHPSVIPDTWFNFFMLWPLLRRLHAAFLALGLNCRRVSSICW